MNKCESDNDSANDSDMCFDQDAFVSIGNDLIYEECDSECCTPDDHSKAESVEEEGSITISKNTLITPCSEDEILKIKTECDMEKVKDITNGVISIHTLSIIIGVLLVISLCVNALMYQEAKYWKYSSSYWKENYDNELLKSQELSSRLHTAYEQTQELNDRLHTVNGDSGASINTGTADTRTHLHTQVSPQYTIDNCWLKVEMGECSDIVLTNTYTAYNTISRKVQHHMTEKYQQSQNAMNSLQDIHTTLYDRLQGTLHDSSFYTHSSASMQKVTDTTFAISEPVAATAKTKITHAAETVGSNLGSAYTSLKQQLEKVHEDTAHTVADMFGDMVTLHYSALYMDV